MKSEITGKITSPEVTNISSHGFWIFWHDQEYFLGFEQYPWFKNSTIRQITHVVAESDSHLHWPDLDVDLSLAILKNPDAYPLKSRPKIN